MAADQRKVILDPSLSRSDYRILRYLRRNSGITLDALAAYGTTGSERQRNNAGSEIAAGIRSQARRLADRGYLTIGSEPSPVVTMTALGAAVLDHLPE